MNFWSNEVLYASLKLKFPTQLNNRANMVYLEHNVSFISLCLFYVFFVFFNIISVVETKDGTVSVAAAFAGHQEGNASA